MRKNNIYLIIISILIVVLLIENNLKKQENKTPLQVKNAGLVTENRTQINSLVSESRRNAITEAVAKVSPAVVGINVKAIEKYRVSNPILDDPFFRYFFGDQIYKREVQSLGSGFIISEDGFILTNEHVIENPTEINITLTDGRKFRATPVGTDFVTDIALLKIEGKNLPHVTLGNSDDIIIGEWAIALGNPFGLFEFNDKPTVTVGVISAVNIDFGKMHNDRIYQDMIQTDASINPGNSGGPLVNSRGEVIGMNAFIFTGGKYSEGSIGLGFAIPINKVKKIVKELKLYGEVHREVWTGVYTIDVTRWIAAALGLREVRGAYITDIKRGSPGEKAGLKKGDVILEVNNIKIQNREDISRIIMEQDLRPGDVLEMKVLRRGRKVTVNLVLEKPPY
ncbi:2-alkenal reductase [candidate division KSB1 bacterium]|nr:MAG: 2-alkenal reductase [candidate division KSB1 bacterium]